jgi:acetolactate synthase I/II/III large subunit
MPTVADLTVEALIGAGIDRLYCLPGVQNDDFFDALHPRQDRLVPVHARHEQGAAYMALGAALASGRPQAFCVVPGPGFLNASAGLATAQSLNARVLALTGEIHSAMKGKGWGALHEIPDQFAILTQLTREAREIGGGETAAATLSATLGALMGGLPGPVGLQVPFDRWLAKADGPVVPALPERAAPDAGLIAEAARALLAAKRPLIWVGGGAQGAAGEVRRLARALSAPVIAFRSGRGVVPAGDPLSLGLNEGHAMWGEADLVLGLGTRMEPGLRAWGTSGMKVLHIDIDPAALGRIAPPDIGIAADLADALPALLAGIEGREPDRRDWLEAAGRAKARVAQRLAGALAPQLAWLDALRGGMPDDAVLVNELTQMGYVANIAFRVHAPRTFLSPGYQGTLGWGIATGLGAADAMRDTPVVAITGDGGALFTIAELATAVRHAIPLVVVVFTDNAFGNVRRFQEEKYGGRTIASDLTSPDFAALAESFGVRGLRAETPEALRARLAEAIEARAPALIAVPVGDFPSPWEHVMLGRVRG